MLVQGGVVGRGWERLGEERRGEERRGNESEKIFGWL